MKTTKTIIFAALIGLMLTACFNSQKQHQDETSSQDLTEVTKLQADYSGNYVSPDYQNRENGYDWVAVSVKNVDATTIEISVRSRADKKKPTCTFDAVAQKKDEITYSTNIEGKVILFTFSQDKIVISTEKAEDSGLLNYYCSGGGSLAGEYTKINEPLDESQIDKTAKQ